ncbi:MAG: hypothetical protein KGM42_02335 [Hyphomicrobiales bacterium]|nr:hypothetical protein [Hyphomicrobiales bacterium]
MKAPAIAQGGTPDRPGHRDRSGRETPSSEALFASCLANDAGKSAGHDQGSRTPVDAESEEAKAAANSSHAAKGDQSTGTLAASAFNIAALQAYIPDTLVQSALAGEKQASGLDRVRSATPHLQSGRQDQDAVDARAAVRAAATGIDVSSHLPPVDPRAPVAATDGTMPKCNEAAVACGDAHAGGLAHKVDAGDALLPFPPSSQPDAPAPSDATDKAAATTELSRAPPLAVETAATVGARLHNIVLEIEPVDGSPLRVDLRFAGQDVRVAMTIDHAASPGEVAVEKEKVVRILGDAGFAVTELSVSSRTEEGARDGSAQPAFDGASAGQSNARHQDERNKDRESRQRNAMQGSSSGALDMGRRAGWVVL